MHVHRQRLRNERGQGTVEYVGLVCVLALLLVAVAAAVRHIRLPPRPGMVVPQIARQATLEHLLGERQQRSGWVRRAGRAVARGATVVATGQVAFVRGFVTAGEADVRGLLRDPIGTLVGGGGGVIAVVRDPAGTFRRVARDGSEYVRLLRTMSLSDAYVQVMFDAGEVAEDLAVSRGKRWAARRALSGARERVGRVESPERARAGQD